MKKKKLLAALLAAGILFGALPATASAESVQAKDLGKTAVRTAADEWQVKLSLPALEVRPSADIVLVMDISSSMKETDMKEAKAAAAAMCDELAEKENVDVRVGVVTFDRDAQIVSPLTSDLEAVKAQINNITAKSETNMMAGLLAGKEMLDQSTAGSQYLVLLSDGIPICWMEDGQVTNKTWHNLNDHIDGNPETSAFQAGTEINQGNAENPRAIQSAADLLSIEGLFKNANAIENDSNHIYASINTGAYLKKDGDPGAYYTNLEAATYHTAKYILENLAGDKANLITVAYGMDKYAGQNAIHYDYGAIFCEWIGEQSDQYYEVGKAGYDGNPGDLSGVFSQIADETVKLIDKGAVTDVIGEGYDLVTNGKAVPFTITKGVDAQAESYEGVLLEDGRYGFCHNGSSYDYIVGYEKQPDGTETVTWQINVPVTKEEPVSLAYHVMLADSVRSNGVHVNLDNMRGTTASSPIYCYSENTNDSAVLNSTDSNGNLTAENLSFPVPSGNFETGVLVVEHLYDGTVSGDPLKLPAAVSSLPVITDWSKGYTPQFTNVENLQSLAKGDYSLAGITVTMPNGESKIYPTEEAFASAMLHSDGAIDAKTGLTKITFSYTGSPISSEPAEPSDPSTSIPDGTSSNEPSSSTSSEPVESDGSSSPEQPTDVPKTGGSVGAAAWILLMFTAAAGLTVAVLYHKKRRA